MHPLRDAIGVRSVADRHHGGSRGKRAALNRVGSGDANASRQHGTDLRDCSPGREKRWNGCQRWDVSWEEGQ